MLEQTVGCVPLLNAPEHMWSNGGMVLLLRRLVLKQLVQRRFHLLCIGLGRAAATREHVGREIVAEVGSFFVIHPFRLGLTTFVVILRIVVPAVLAGVKIIVALGTAIGSKYLSCS
jgi:hypothetical protein